MLDLDKVHGRYAEIAFRKLNNAIFDHAPQKGKGLYHGFVAVPVRFASNLVRSAVEPIEQVASGLIHLVGSAFAKDKKAEFMKARDFIVIELPASTIFGLFSVIQSPFHAFRHEKAIWKNPVAYEEQAGKKRVESSVKVLGLINEIRAKVTNNADEKRLNNVMSAVRFNAKGEIDRKTVFNYKQTFHFIYLISKYADEFKSLRAGFKNMGKNFNGEIPQNKTA